MKTVDKLEVNRIYSMEEGLAMQDQEIEFVEGQEAMAHIRAFQSKSTEIAIAQEKKEFNLPEQYADFADVFDAKEFDQLPGTSTMGSCHQPSRRSRRRSQAKRQAIPSEPNRTRRTRCIPCRK